MNANEFDTCEACGDRGWRLMFNTDSRGFEVQRCDSCSRFLSDHDAQMFVAEDTTNLVSALFEYNRALLAEAQQALDRTTVDESAPILSLKTIRDSLRNACDLQTTGSAEWSPTEEKL